VSELRLIPGEVEDGPFSAGTPLPRRLPPGRHGIPSDLVAEHQRQRILVSLTEALARHGYANLTTTQVSEGASVSTSTFYKHFGNLWDCALAAYVAVGDRLCEEIEVACAEADPRSEPLDVGIGAALAFCAAEPAAGQLLCAQAPRGTTALTAARRLLIARLAAMLRRLRGVEEDGLQPPRLDERLIDATFAFLSTRIARGETDALPELGPELAAILERPRRAA
jgi:AcrR family transcriptional regulator